MTRDERARLYGRLNSAVYTCRRLSWLSRPNFSVYFQMLSRMFNIYIVSRTPAVVNSSFGLFPASLQPGKCVKWNADRLEMYTASSNEYLHWSRPSYFVITKDFEDEYQVTAFIVLGAFYYSDNYRFNSNYLHFACIIYQGSSDTAADRYFWFLILSYQQVCVKKNRSEN